MRTPSFASALLAAFLIGTLGSMRGTESEAVSDADLTYFYKAPSPERVARLVAYFDALRAAEKPSTRPPLMGFFAAAFVRYPADIDKMIPDSVSPQMLGLLAVSLRLAGQQARAESLVGRLKSRDDEVPNLATIPSSLDAVEAIGPNEFDLLWGASFATGDSRYCSKILRHLAESLNGDNVDDLVRLVTNRESGTDQQWIVEKRGKDKAIELVSLSTTLWALHSNAQQHPFVQVMVNEYVTAHPSEPAAKALLALAHQYGYYSLGKLVSAAESSPGQHTATINIAYFSQILDDLGRHAGSYPAHFEFAEDRPRAEKDVTTISNLLDPLTENFSKNPPMLLRLAILHAIGFNLDIPDSFPKAVVAFDKLLSLTPDDPQANYRYGSFLATTTKDGRAIPFLERARSLGVQEADYPLGFSYAVAGNKAKAIENLERYTKRVPTDERAKAMLDAIRNDRFDVKVGAH